MYNEWRSPSTHLSNTAPLQHHSGEDCWRHCDSTFRREISGENHDFFVLFRFTLLCFLDRLEAASEKIDQFNVEEEAYEWELSQYPLRRELETQLNPYLKLYETTVEFNAKHK